MVSASARRRAAPPRLSTSLTTRSPRPRRSEIKVRFADLGATALTGSPAEFGKLLVDETEKWGKVVKFAGIKAE